MAIIDLDAFMSNLKRLIYDTSNELIRSNRFIRAKMSEIELLYKEFGYLIGSALNDMDVDEKQLHGLEDAEKWKRRLMDIAQKAENAVDMFISSAILNESESKALGWSLKLNEVINDLKSIRKDMRPKIRNFWNKSSVNNENIQQMGCWWRAVLPTKIVETTEAEHPIVGSLKHQLPHLRKLDVRNCKNLKEIPLGLGDISTLEQIEIHDSKLSVFDSVDKIQQEQRSMGNYDIHVKFVEIHKVFFNYD